MYEPSLVQEPSLAEVQELPHVHDGGHTSKLPFEGAKLHVGQFEPPEDGIGNGATTAGFFMRSGTGGASIAGFLMRSGFGGVFRSLGDGPGGASLSGFLGTNGLSSITWGEMGGRGFGANGSSFEITDAILTLGVLLSGVFGANGSLLTVTELRPVEVTVLGSTGPAAQAGGISHATATSAVKLEKGIFFIAQYSLRACERLAKKVPNWFLDIPCRCQSARAMGRTA